MAHAAATAPSAGAPVRAHPQLPALSPPERRVRLGAWGGLLLLAASLAWLQSGLANPDGISYLDLAAAAAARGPHALVNAYWSPAYPLLLAVAMAATDFPRTADFALAHGVNVLVFVLALCCFEAFLVELLRHVRRRGDLSPAAAAWLRLAAYACFGYDSIVLISPALLTPDLLVSAIVYLLAALLLRLSRGKDGLPTYVALGCVIAVGYLTKAALLPLGCLALGFAGVIGWRRHAGAHTAAGLALAMLAAASLSLPYVAAISRERGRLTLGETGRLNYAWWVEGVPQRYWDGSPAGNGQPLHPPRTLPGVPAVHAFAGGVPGTYPVWYEPGYWYEGLQARFDARRQLGATVVNAERLLAEKPLALVLVVFATLLAGLRLRAHARPIQWTTWALPAAAVLLYLAVYVEMRYFAGFAAVAIAGELAGIARAPRARPILAGLALLFGAGCGYVLLRGGMRPVIAPASGDRVALERLREGGAKPGASIALVGDPWHASWAYLGEYHIVADVSAPGFWRASPERQREILLQLRSAGASFVAAEVVPHLTAAAQADDARAHGTILVN